MGHLTQVFRQGKNLRQSKDCMMLSLYLPDADFSRSLQWGLTFKTLSRTYSERFQYTLSDEPVKVAILDTGVDLNHLDFLQPRSKPKNSGKMSSVKGEEAQIKRIKSCRNFCDDRSNMEDVTDIDGHGTHVAGIILQLAPTAELYIARVCQGDDSYGNSLTNDEQQIPRDRVKQWEGDKKVYPDRVERVSPFIKKYLDSADVET